MEVKIIENEKSKWNYPCKGIRKEDNLIVGFSSYGRGVVLDSGQANHLRPYEFECNWEMDNFKPIEEEKLPIDWDKVELPIWVKDKCGQLIQITSIKGAELKYCIISNKIAPITYIFPTQGLAKKWLNSLEILPKGTKIEITI